MRKILRPQHIKLSNYTLLKCTRNTHELINKQASEYLKLNELRPNFASIQYLVNKVLHDFETFQICLNLCVTHRIKLYKTIPICRKTFKRKISKTTLYKFKKKFIKTYVYTHTYTFTKLLDKTRRPKLIHYQYRQDQLNEIATTWAKRDHEKIFNYSDYLYKLRMNKIEMKTLSVNKQQHLSFATMIKAINNYYKRVPMPRKCHKHSLRKYDISFGLIQFDVKVIGKEDNKFGVNIYCVDMVDEKSGIVFGRASTSYPKLFLLNVFKDAHAFYSRYFNVTRTRTDHALAFKRTESFRTGEFNDLLTQLGIIHQYSFWNEPETNGKIENVHLQIDNELLEFINKCDTIEEAINLINRWYVVFNSERTKGYKLWNHNLQKWCLQRMTPFQSLTFDFSQYT